MFWNAKNGRVSIGDDTMDYVSFGTGPDCLILIPGLGDGLRTVKGMALPMSAAYRIYARKYKVYVFSRKNQLPEGCSTKEMAKDLAAALRALNIRKADCVGISQGGMIAQYLAIDYPDLVSGLVLAVTASRPNEQLQRVVGSWIKLAQEENYRDLAVDTAEKSYSEPYLQKYRLFFPLLVRIGKPANFTRFLIQANSCLTHNAFQELDRILCPTLVIGGGRDLIVGSEASKEIAERIPASRLFLYRELGHAAYEEAPDFHKRVLNFLQAK